MLQLVLYLSLALLIAPAYAQNLSDGEIAGIAIGAVAGFVIIVILLLCCCYMFLAPQDDGPNVNVIRPPPPQFGPQQPVVINQPPQCPPQQSGFSKFPYFGNWFGGYGQSGYGQSGYGNSGYGGGYGNSYPLGSQQALGYY